MNELHLQSRIALNDGRCMPVLGFGVYKSGIMTGAAVSCALATGYRLIDTAAIYGNEVHVGHAIRDSGIPRRELFITTKLWNTDQELGTQYEACMASLERLGLDYLDLYLIHWPGDHFLRSWTVMESLFTAGRIRSLGVSNFGVDELKTLLTHCEIPPAVNQIEFHPRYRQRAVREFCREHHIVCEAWSPLLRGAMARHEVPAEIGAKYGKTAAQTVLRWDLQHGLVTIPQAVDPAFIGQNADIFDFELSKDDMGRLDALDEGRPLAFA